MMRQTRLALLLGTLSFAMVGCVIFAGSLQGSTELLSMINDQAHYYQKSDEGPRGIAGKLTLRAGDTITAIGYWKKGMLTGSFYLINYNGAQVFVNRFDVHTGDDRRFQRVRGPFLVPTSNDLEAWRRAQAYVKNSSPYPIEVSNANLIKTAGATDTLGTAYTITRVPQGANAEYEVVCYSIRKGFDTELAAQQLGYYLLTGSWYTFEE